MVLMSVDYLVCFVSKQADNITHMYASEGQEFGCLSSSSD